MTTTFEDIRSAAANGKGVTLIPFDNLRVKADAVADEVDRCKDVVSRWGYDLFEKQKNNLLKEKKTKQDAIEAKKKEIEDFKKKNKESNTAPFEEDQKKLESELKSIDESIDKMNRDLEDGAEAWKRVWNARGGLREIFDDVLKEVSNVRSHPSDYIGSTPTDKDKEIFEKSLDVIEGDIKDEEEEHKKQEEGAKGTEQKFRELLKKSAL